jgi:hypothetical protein
MGTEPLNRPALPDRRRRQASRHEDARGPARRHWGPIALGVGLALEACARPPADALRPGHGAAARRHAGAGRGNPHLRG